MKGWRPRASAMAMVAVATIGARAQPQTYSGSGDYRVYCSSCHGADARGDGPIAGSLKKRPADLTQLTRRNNGVFPDEKVFKTIEGPQPGSGHRDSDMPAWAGVFARASESAGADKAAARIGALVKYLQTLQAK